VCHVLEAAVTTEGSFILIAVEANRFLYHMVRVIAGTLMEVGRGRMKPEQVGVALRTKDRRAAGPTRGRPGLTLPGRYGNLWAGAGGPVLLWRRVARNGLPTRKE
jgi:tRNA pseudouridine38-40 synthase